MFSEFCSFGSALCQSHRRKHRHRQIEKIGVGGAQCHLPNKGTPDRGKESSNYLYSNRKRTTAAAKWKSGEGWREIFIISFPQQFLCGIRIECILPRKLSLPEKGCWCGWWECPECGHFHVGAGGWSGGRSPEVLVQRCFAGKGPGMQLWSWPPPPSPGTNGSEHRKSPSRACQRLTPTPPPSTQGHRHENLERLAEADNMSNAHNTCPVAHWETQRQRRHPHALTVPVKCSLNPIKVLVHAQNGMKDYEKYLYA